MGMGIVPECQMAEHVMRIMLLVINYNLNELIYIQGLNLSLFSDSVVNMFFSHSRKILIRDQVMTIVQDKFKFE